MYNCNNIVCNRVDLKEGVQCTGADLSVNEIYCSFICLKISLERAIVFRNILVEHFWNEHLEIPVDGRTCKLFVKTHRHKFLGQPKVSTETQRRSDALDQISSFVLGCGW